MLLDDYLNFFDNIAFVDNPHWSSCYCFFPQAPHETCVWKERTAEENRADVTQNIIKGKMNGYLAYDKNHPIGWCNAGPRVNMTITPDYDEPDADKIGAITCFIIAKEYRNKGVARLLLKTACEEFKMQGFNYVEGYPMKDVIGEAPNHWGPMDLYASEGFKKYAIEDDTIVMRKTLNV
jgi:ribosomal protein S18 acetylase RimI-like enzyme